MWQKTRPQNASRYSKPSLLCRPILWTRAGSPSSGFVLSWLCSQDTQRYALYMAPDGPERMKLAWDGNGFEGEVSSDAAGIIATLFTLSHMSMAFRGADHLAEHYHRLLDFAAEHEDSRMIFAAID